MKTLFPIYFSSSSLEEVHTCELKWFQKYCRKLDMGTKSHHLIAGSHIAKALEITRRAFYEEGQSKEDSIDIGSIYILEAEDTGDVKKSNENIEHAFRQYFRKFPLEKGIQPCRLENGGAAIEYQFEIDLGIKHPELPTNLYFTGKLDFLGERVLQNKVFRYVVDDKTCGSVTRIPDSDLIDIESEKEEYEMRGQFCLTEDHEILTEIGWLNIKDYITSNKKENILCWENGTLIWNKPYQVVEKEFSGELIEYSGQINILGTPEHRQVVLNRKNKKYETYTLETIPLSKDKYQFIAGGIINSDNSLGLSKEYLQLLIAFQADGCWSHDTSPSGMFCFSKDRKIERLRDILVKGKVLFTENTYESDHYSTGFYTNFRIIDKKINEFLMEYLGEKKEFNSFLLDCSLEEINLILDELSFWDGYKEKRSGNTIYTSTNKNNIDWVQTLCALSGKYGNICVNSNNKRNEKHSICYNLRISEKLYKATNRQEKTYIPFIGQVYCVNVPSSYFIVRYKGKILVTGNCAYHWAARKLGIKTHKTLVRRIPLLSKFEPAFELEIDMTDHQVFWWEQSTLTKLQSLVDKYNVWKKDGSNPRHFFSPIYSTPCTKWGRSVNYKMGENHDFSGKGCEYKIGCISKDGDDILMMKGKQNMRYPEVEQGQEISLEQFLRQITNGK